jgi:hypothetical protein
MNDYGPFFWERFSFYAVKLAGACWQVYEDGSAYCWSFVWSVPW